MVFDRSAPRTGRYEFSEADAACALQAIDSWVDGAAHGAQHISPEKVGTVSPLSCMCWAVLSCAAPR